MYSFALCFKTQLHHSVWFDHYLTCYRCYHVSITALTSLNRSHENVRQGLTIVSPEISGDTFFFFFLHIGSCDAAHDQ